MQKGLQGKQNRKQAAVAAVTAFLAAWRMQDALGISKDGYLLESQALCIVLGASLFLLFYNALIYRNARLKRIAYGVGLVFSAFTVVGKPLETAGAFTALGWMGVLDGVFLWLLFTVVYGSALLLIYRGVLGLMQRDRAPRRESLFSRILGNPFVVFVFLLACWVPVWLAFWPGTFVADSVTQFYMYLDEAFTTHHPLLHTLLLGFCMMFGIDHSEDGSATVGLAIYSGVQLVLMAAIIAYACHWLRKRNAPVGLRVFVSLFFGLFPFYPLWNFSAQKDILFGGLVLLMILQLADIWRDGFKALRLPIRWIAFIITSALMMLMRNNGFYAFCLLIPFAIIYAKGARFRVTALLAGCAAVYLLANSALIWATDATIPCKVEFLSIPLQQIARTLRDHPEAIAEDTDGVLDTLYGTDPAQFYNPRVADSVKWATDYDVVDDNLSSLLSLWRRLGAKYPVSYFEAFLVQNLPYFLPGADMPYNFDLGVIQIDIFTIEEHSYFPELRKLYSDYDQTMTFLGIPGVRLLSDTAFYVWLCLAGFGLALYNRQRQWMAGFVFLLAIWITCLVGPVALMRYMLGLFYSVPVMFAAMFAPKEIKPAAAPAAVTAAELAA
ncbi:MAG: DUF6020 family protein [Eubacteriales bacterium]|nr:DUF6020 family protein [Eubacteriales bacterium]